MHGIGYDMWSFGGGLMMVLWWLVPIAIAVGVAAYISRRSGHRTKDEALEILRERFARGEIGSEEFQEAKRHLGG